jgi:GTP-binding protein
MENQNLSLKPTLAIVGRPNVGKSTLFNRITKTRSALVADIAGLTRDPKVGLGKIGEKDYIVVDTGGIDSSEENEIGAIAREKSLEVARECNAIILVVDGRTGLNAADELLADNIRRFNKHIVIAVNKSEGLDQDYVIAEFSTLQIGNIIPISASHGEGIVSLIEDISVDWPSINEISNLEDTSERIKISVIGRPNVGKSTLVNQILGHNSMITSDIPGTTRDSVDFDFTWRNQDYTIIDTAGIRRKGKTRGVAEKFSVMQSLQALEHAHVIVLVVDAKEGITDQDLHLLGLTLDNGGSLVIATNKWDTLDEEGRENCLKELDRRLTFAKFVEICKISALKGKGLKNLFLSINKSYEASIRKHKTKDITNILLDAVASHPTPMVRGRRVKLRFAHMGGENPPKIVIHGNLVETLPASYKKYLENFFRSALNLIGTPIKLFFLNGDNPYSGRKNQLTKRQQNKRRRLMQHVKKK